MKDLSHLKRQINNQLASISNMAKTHRALLAEIEQETTLLKSVHGRYRKGVLVQATYQSYKARTTPERHALHCQVVEVKAAIKNAKDELQTLQAAHALGLKAQQERQKDNLFLEGKAIYDTLTGAEQNALDHYMLSKSYARTN
tara:strand:- start:2165 stop:2593 length:429 start_codon:yes stop_codon:yes gene_type:complete